MTSWICMAGLTGIIGAAFWFFDPLAALWLAILSALVYRHPDWGVSILLATLSIDRVAPVLGGILVSFSELHLAAAVLAFLAREREGPLDWRPMIWALPFLAAVALSGIAHIEWYKVPPHIIRASEWSAACFLTLNAFQARGSLAKARWALACSGAFYCISGFLQFPAAHAARIFSFFTNPNQFAGYLGMLSPFFVMFFLSATGRRIRPIWGYLAVITLLAMVISASRTALLSLVASWLVLGWLHYWKGARLFIHDPIGKSMRFFQHSGRALLLHGLVAGLALYLTLWLGGFDTLMKRSARLVDTDTNIAESRLGIRLPYFRLGLRVWKEHWLLGVGPGRWKEAAEALLPETQDWMVRNRQSFEKTILIHSHNLYIHLGAVLGLTGLLAFLFWIGRVCLELVRHVSVWPRAGTGLLVAFLVHNLFDVTFPSLGQELGCLIGLALAGCQDSDET